MIARGMITRSINLVVSSVRSWWGTLSSSCHQVLINTSIKNSPCRHRAVGSGYVHIIHPKTTLVKYNIMCLYINKKNIAAQCFLFIPRLLQVEQPSSCPAFFRSRAVHRYADDFSLRSQVLFQRKVKLLL